MPKMRSHSGAKKRFMVSPAGKVKRAQKGKNHILTKKSPKRKRRLRKGTMASETNVKAIKKMLPYA